jgi:hypothetical protein
MVRVRWTVPVQLAGNVSSAVAVADPLCASPSGPIPARWSLRPVGRPGAGEEVWRVAGTQLVDMDSEPERRILGFQKSDEITRAVGLASGGVPAWLLIAPRSGAYEMVIEWESAESSAALAARPCIKAWVETPLETAFGITTTPSPGPRATTGAVSRGAQERPDSPNTSDEGLSAAPRPRVEDARTTEEDRRVEDVLRVRHGLLGVPEYDLSRLHQAAVQVEMRQVPGQPLAAEDQREADRLRALRASLLEALHAGGEAGQGKLCRLVWTQGMAERPLRLWNGEATIPAADAARCPRLDGR